MPKRETGRNGLAKQILDWLRAHDGVFAVKQHGSMFSEAGIPDILACVNGRFLAIEVKVDTQVTQIQRVQLNRVERAGGVALVAHSLVEVQAAVFLLLDRKKETA